VQAKKLWVMLHSVALDGEQLPFLIELVPFSVSVTSLWSSFAEHHYRHAAKTTSSGA